MSLSVFQRVLARMVADPGYRRSIAADPAAVLDGERLSLRERHRIESFSRDPGMRVNTVLYRANRLAPIHNALPRTCRALGSQLGKVLQEFWSSSELEDLQFPHEVARFVAFLRRIASGQLAAVRGLSSLLDTEVAIFELLMLPREKLRRARARARGASTRHPLVRVVPVDVHPLDLAEVIDGTRELDQCTDGAGGLLIDHREDPGRVVALTDAEVANFDNVKPGPTFAQLRAAAIAWVQRYATDWRNHFAAAAPAAQQQNLDSLAQMPAKTRVTVFIKTDGYHPVAASAVIVTMDGTEQSLAVDVIDVDGPEAPVAMLGDDMAYEYARGMWRTMIRNWWPGRLGIASELNRPPAQRLSDEAYIWCVPGAISDYRYEKHLAVRFQPPTPVATPSVPIAASPSTANPHLYAAEQQREWLALRRWLPDRLGELVRAMGLEDRFWTGLGLNSPAWVLLNARRSDVFGSNDDGDIDLIAGPMRFPFDEREWDRRIRAAQSELPLHYSRTHAADRARDLAASDGLIEWPPAMDTIVACEVKASWFDAAAGAWKSSHAAKQNKIIKQLSHPLNAGVDHVAFLHLAATQPANRGGHPWIEAAFDAHDAGEILRANPTAYDIFTAKDRPDCGYFRAVMGAVDHATEDYAGAGGRLETVIPVGLNPNRDPSAPWREQLRQRLARLPTPRFPQVFVEACPRCHSWLSSSLLRGACECPERAAKKGAP